ncbi:MAG: arginine--tRNA ligase [Bacteroidia bacterium]
MNILDQLKREISDSLKELYQAEDQSLKFENTNPNFEGDITFVVFPLLRISKKGPEQTAQEIGESLIGTSAMIDSFNVVKGFLNLVFKQEIWLDYLKEHVESGVVIPRLANKGEKVAVEYSSPNTNKPLHLGHIRNNVLGFSMSQILDANGFDVIKTNIVNDRGVHICKSMLAWQKFANGETPESSGLKGDHFVGKYYVKFDQAFKEEQAKLIEGGMSAEEAEQSSNLMQEVRKMLKDWEEGEKEVVALWKKMNAWVYSGFDISYKTLGVSFDHIYYESETYLRGKESVLKGVEDGIFYQKEDGSIWVDLTDEGLDQKLLLRSDGTSVYMTQDIGTASMRFEDHKMDRSIYVVGNEQDYHFKVLQLVCKKLGYSFWEGIYHLSYGMVDLPSGKMKSREGTVVDADDLMSQMVSTARKQTEELGKTEGMDEKELGELYHMLGLGAIKYFLLKVDAKTRMLFDPQESIDFQGNTGPFIQYTHTRILSILRAAGDTSLALTPELNSDERKLIHLLYDYPSVVNDAARTYNPSLIANAAYELAKYYNKFYHQHSILGADNQDVRSFRILLSKQVGLALKHAFGLLGIDMPERM